MNFCSLRNQLIKQYFGVRLFTRISVLAFILLTYSSISFAQAAGSGVTGIVTDAAGAVVPGATVTLTDTKTSRELTTKTNDQGAYKFQNVSPGAGYKLTFTLQGFQTYVLNEVTIATGVTATDDAQLTAGQVSAVIEVTSTTGEATLNTTDPSIGNVIGTRQLKELPIQLRGSPA
ncbi:MAG TPA: carboxypeptidase-like regulatory domain-containing protein, partial [Pyrinomonadaceae bacterium]|nr:carboxypeptidase-like regulatory domain-containing protein [Pyrinomonadaceae bacterium]